MAQEKEKILKILAVQMFSEIANVKANYDKVEKLLLESCGDFDVIVLPEVWTVGWSCRDFQKYAEELDSSETIAFLSRLAKTYNAYVIGGSFITKDNKCSFYNTCPVLNREGELIATYNKMHLFCDEAEHIKKGSNPVIVDIEGFKFGLTICYDIRFPEIYRAYRSAGVDVLVDVAAWSKTKKTQWQVMTSSRAIENQSYMIAVNAFGPIEDDENLGCSIIVDYKGTVISEKETGEGTIHAEIKLDDMYEFRNKFKILDDICENYDVRNV